MLTVGELFAGIGGGGLGLEQTGGFKTIWSVEIEAFCNEIRKRHWPDVPQFRDIRATRGLDSAHSFGCSRRFGHVQRSNPRAPWIEMRHELEPVDVIVGGSPCQDLSCAGKRVGLGGKRSGLFLEMVRIVRELSPRYVVWENVRGAFSSRGGADFRAVLGYFSDLGYDAEWTMLRASDFGYPHGRARVFLVAYRPGARCEGEGEGAGVREERGGECVSGEGRGAVANAGDGQFSIEGRRQKTRDGVGSTIEKRKLGNASRDDEQWDRKSEEGIPEITDRGRCGGIPFAPPGPNDAEAWREIIHRWPWLAPAVEPGFCGVVDGVSFVVDDARAKRLKALGNAVVLACARRIGEQIILWEEREKK